MLTDSFNLENFQRHCQQTIPEPSGMSDKTENVNWQPMDALSFIALYSILWRHNAGWGAEQELACEQALHLGEGNEPRENARAEVPSLSCFLSRAARACTWRDPPNGELARRLGKKPTSLMIRGEWLPAGLKENSST